MKVERILVRGVNWLGDAVMSLPALQRLREAKPRAHITMLSHEKLADLWQICPSIDAHLTFTSNEKVWEVGRRLRREKFELGLLFPNSARSALELWLGGVPERIGYAGQWRHLLLTRFVPQRSQAVAMKKRPAAEIRELIKSPAPSAPSLFSSEAHHLHHYLHLVAVLGANPTPVPPRLTIADDTRAEIVRRFNLSRLAQASPWLGLNPGAEYGPAKRWPAEKFIAAALEIQRRSGCRWIIFGGKRDRALAKGIASAIQAAGKGPPDRNSALDFSGKTTLRELCALLSACRVLLTNDTGPMHLAAALGTPVVVPFGSTSPELTGPGLPGDMRNRLLKSDVPCAPCFRRECPIDFRCMHGISVGAVADAVMDLLGTHKSV
jgi:heptosyltransferase-2